MVLKRQDKILVGVLFLRDTEHTHMSHIHLYTHHTQCIVTCTYTCSTQYSFIGWLIISFPLPIFHLFPSRLLRLLSVRIFEKERVISKIHHSREKGTRRTANGDSNDYEHVEKWGKPAICYSGAPSGSRGKWNGAKVTGKVDPSVTTERMGISVCTAMNNGIDYWGHIFGYFLFQSQRHRTIVQLNLYSTLTR